MYNDKCPYSENGKCVACRKLSIPCDGAKYILCNQYGIESGRITFEEIVKRANTYP